MTCMTAAVCSSIWATFRGARRQGARNAWKSFHCCCRRCFTCFGATALFVCKRLCRLRQSQRQRTAGHARPLAHVYRALAAYAVCTLLFNLRTKQWPDSWVIIPAGSTSHIIKINGSQLDYVMFAEWRKWWTRIPTSIRPLATTTSDGIAGARDGYLPFLNGMPNTRSNSKLLFHPASPGLSAAARAMVGNECHAHAKLAWNYSHLLFIILMKWSVHKQAPIEAYNYIHLTTVILYTCSWIEWMEFVASN